MKLRNILARIADALRPSEDKQEVDRKYILAIAENYPLRSEWADIVDVWPLVLYGLNHQGHPRDRLNALLNVLEKRESRGWDEFSIDFQLPDSKIVGVMFIRDERQCETERLLSVLRDLNKAIESNFVD